MLLFLLLTLFAAACLECRHEKLALIATLSALAVMLEAFSGVPLLAYQ